METLKLQAVVKGAVPVVALDPALPPGRYRVTMVASGVRGESLPAEIDIVIMKLRLPQPEPV